MEKNPLAEKLKTMSTTLGLRVTHSDQVELAAFLGFDWFMLDQMFTSADWSYTREVLKTGQAAGITPIIRIPGNPWLGYNHQLAIDATRAFGMGAQFVMVSHSCKKEIEECLTVTGDWHRNALTVHPFRNKDEWKTKAKDIADSNYIIAHAESQGSYDEFDETIELRGLKMFFFAMTDASKVLTGSAEPDWYNPKLWKFIEKAVMLGEKKRIMIGANTSYGYSMKEMRKRVNFLHDHGVKFIYIQSAGYLFQTAIGEFMDDVRKDLKL